MVDYDSDGIPKSTEFYKAVLECFRDRRQYKIIEIEQHVSEKFNLTEEQREKETSPGHRKTYNNTARAISHFYERNFLEKDKNSNYWITDLGLEELETNFQNISRAYLKNFPKRGIEENKYVTLKTKYEVVDEWESFEELEKFVTNAYKSEESNSLLLFNIGEEKYANFFSNAIGNFDFIFIKENFEKYMVDIKNLFLNPEDESIDKNEMKNIYTDCLSNLKDFEDVERIKMKFDHRDQSNFYIKIDGESKYYELLRKIIIPEKSQLSILKLRNDDELLYYFKISISDIEYFVDDLKKFDRNKIFFGAPGTGKSFQLNKDRKELIHNENDYERVTFHPDYSYAQFVGTYRPVPKEENGKKTISYEYVPGPFMRVLSKAIENSRSSYPRPFLLVIEEINRANMAAVFGDVFQLLDRDEENNSRYPINLSKEMKEYLEEEIKYDSNTIKIPSNMFIWATMNSADQGVFPMDTAFKRRWDFEYIDIDNNEEKIKDITFEVNNTELNWNNLRKSLNNFLLDNNINEDKLLGPFFISNIEEFKNNSTDFKEIFKSKVLMYLYEDAAKSIKNLLFEPITKKKLSYSLVCKKFDSKGIDIFKKEIKDFYEDLISNE